MIICIQRPNIYGSNERGQRQEVRSLLVLDLQIYMLNFTKAGLLYAKVGKEVFFFFFLNK